MKKAVLLAAVLGVCGIAWGADAGKLPAPDVAADRQVAEQIVTEGAAGVKAVLGKVVPLGTGDDTKQRMAVSALVRHCTRPGAEAERAMVAKELVDALKAATDDEVRSFYILQLQWCGKDEAVEALATHLNDKLLGFASAAALQRIGTPAAGAALAKALAGAKETKVAIVTALGALRYAAAGDALKEAARAEDAKVRDAAFYALANAPVPGSRIVLEERATATDVSAEQHGRAVADYALYALRMGQAGATDECRAICRNLMLRNERNTQAQALSVLVDVFGEQARGDLLAALDSSDNQLRFAALQQSSKLKDAETTRQLLAKAKGELAAEVLPVVAQRGDPAAGPAIVGMLSEKDLSVRAAAAGALAKLLKDDAIPHLLKAAAVEPDARALTDTLARMPGETVLSAVAGAVAAAPVKTKVALLDILGARMARQHAPVALAQSAAADEPVRMAALRALGRIAREQDAAALVKWSLDAKDDAEETAALKAVVTAAAQGKDVDARSAELLKALPSATGAKRGAIVRTLGRVGGAPALTAVTAELKSKDKAHREAAVRSLADWPDAAAAPALLELAREEKELTPHVLALRGLVNVIKNSPLSPADKVRRYGDALAAARRVDEKKLVLGTASAERVPEAVALVAPSLDDEALKAEAALAVVKIVVPQRSREKVVTGPGVKEALAKAVPLCPDANLKQKGKQFLETMK